jgi:mRNA interferase MazF
MSLSRRGRGVNPASGVDPSRGDIWLVNLDPVLGHEQGGTRSALVISADPLNRSPSGLVIVLPVTGTDRGIRSHIPIQPPDGGLTKPSVILADQIRTISKARIGRRLGVVSRAKLEQVEEVLRFIQGL